jgi:signal peptidase II
MTTGAPVESTSTWRSQRAWVVLILVTVIGLGMDLTSKSIAFRYVAGTPVVINREEVIRTGFASDQIPPHKPVVVVPHVLEFTLVANQGAVFGMAPGKRWVFILFTVAALAFGILLFGTWTRPREWLAHVALGLLLAGGLGNLYDRWLFACVRDFIHPLPHVKLPFGWHYPWGGASATEVWPYVSNVADLFLIIGIGVLVVRALRSPKAVAEAPNTAQ